MLILCSGELYAASMPRPAENIKNNLTNYIFFAVDEFAVITSGHTPQKNLPRKTV